MLRLAAEAGLRRAEVAQVPTRDVVDGIAGPQLTVRGKGGKTRVIPLSGSLADVLRAGVARHTRGASPSGWLFPNVGGGHLTAGHVGKLVDRALPDGYTMHSLWHRFATRAYRGSRNVRTVQNPARPLLDSHHDRSRWAGRTHSQDVSCRSCTG